MTTITRFRRFVSSAAAGTLMLLAFNPTIAHAGTAGGQVGAYSRALLVYTANLGETNDVTVTGSGGTYSIHDSAGVTAGTDCTSVDANDVTCTSTTGYAFSEVKVHTKDGNDIIHVNVDITATLDGGSGNDTLVGEGAYNYLAGGPGADVLSAGPTAGTVVADYSLTTAPVNVTLDGVANDGATGEGDNVTSGVNTVYGGSGDDHLTGNGGKNYLNGLDGNDTVSGLGGADGVAGGYGNDVVSGGGGPDNVNGGPGDDTLYGNGGNDTIYSTPGTDKLLGGSGDDTLNSVDGTTADSLACGPGTDAANVDIHDTVSADCENVTIS